MSKISMYRIFSNTLFYFTLLTIKYFFYSEIILGFLKNYDFLLNFNSNYLSILFISLFLGISHFFFIEYFFKNFVTSFFQINLMKIFLVPSLLYGVKLFNISRILLASGIILWIIFDIIFNIKPTINYLIILLIPILLLIQILNNESENYINNNLITEEVDDISQIIPNSDYFLDEKTNNCLNTFSTNSLDKNRVDDDANKLFVVGHAYGNHDGTNLGISNKLLAFFDKADTTDADLILTGDIVKDSSLNNLNLAKTQIENLFNNYYIAVGNHDIGGGNQNFYYEIFDNDLYLVDYENFSIVVANFSTYNWQPALKDQVLINSFLEKSTKENILIFSHPVFWHNLTQNIPARNGDDMLKVELKKDTLDWLKVEKKNLIIFSGDYGGKVSETFCEYDELNNILFIASGIYDKADDRIIYIYDSKEGFFLKEIPLD